MKSLALAMGALVFLAGPTMAQVNDFNDVTNIRNATPKCKDHPNAKIIGRVSGNVENVLWPVSFVGCFNDMATCERWKGNASSIIDSTLIQNSCRPRN